MTSRDDDRPRRKLPSRPFPRRFEPEAEPPAPAGTAAEAAGDRWTIGRLLTWTTDFLGKKGAESPRLDAEVLLAQVLDCPRVQLYTH